VAPAAGWDDRIRNEFEVAAQEIVDRLLAVDEPPSIWSFMATTEGDFFWPVVAAEG
jgi:hypothetical protein